ncbi:xanthine dehydrogenase family protein molybdopterin-binding subunit [Povalibacter sp.]|uniref:xanthine dehydrogenase family protein molybdopterin-binding subunit n=1 Tax=Povalibacter sp. TaxID=1962978 RepID=UPI002F40187B
MTLAATAVSRRNFLIGSASAVGGLSLGFHIPDVLATTPSAAMPPEVNAWVVIKPDDTVVIRMARTEMGQGSLTGLAQLVAEELECDWSKVTTEYALPGQNVARGRVWGSFVTGGSTAIRGSQEYLRKGGAAAREMLIAAAAANWKVPAAECFAADSVITHRPSGRKVTFGVVATAAAGMTPPENVTLKDPKEWKLIGKPVARLDTVDKTNGKQIFGADLQLPGMLNATVRACPIFGGNVKSFDEAAVARMPGVRKVLQIDARTMVVVADTWWQAKTAMDALPIVWDEGPNIGMSSESIAATLKEGLEASDAFIDAEVGDAPAVIAKATRKISAVYAYPFQAHATMEPMNATARYTPQKCEVWAPTQNGEAALTVAAETAGLPVQQCEVYKLHPGGGFGRRAVQDFVRQAVLVAKAIPGTPVKLLWTREEDMVQGPFHPTSQCKLTGALDDEGNLTALRVRIAGPSIAAHVRPEAMQGRKDSGVFHGLSLTDADHLGYNVDNLLIDHAMRNLPIPPGYWRGVNLNQNAVYLECFIDELAHEAGVDPLVFRRKLMTKHPKHLAVLDAVAKGIGWETPPPKGVHRGIAQFMGYGSYVAAAAEVSVTAGQLKIHRLVAASDMGYNVNPAQTVRQVEGSFVFGLSALLYGGCTVQGGRMVEDNFHTYQVMRLAEMPAVDTHIVPSGGFWGGVGEPTIAVGTPAVLNAIFAATGKRIRSLPLKNHNLA